jgi:hypothetical protein
MKDSVVLAHDLLVGAGLRDRVAIICSGKITTGFDMARAFALGADGCNAARPFLFSLGCIQALQCNSNKCPTGITTQNPDLVKGLVVEEKWKRVYLYQKNTLRNMREVLGAAGVDDPSQLRREKINRRISHAETKTYLDFYPRAEPSSLIYRGAPEKYQQLWENAGLLLDQMSGKIPPQPQNGRLIPQYVSVPLESRTNNSKLHEAAR